jgi:hypothetical protein
LDEYECVFTCPPYYNTEIYSGGEYKNIEEYKKFLNEMIKHSIKLCVKYFVIVINHVYLDLVKEEGLKNGLIHAEEKKLGVKYNHFQLTDNIKNIKSEYMVIFKTQY